MIELDVTCYKGKYKSFNDVEELNINRLDLSRALITVGKEGFLDTLRQGYYRIIELFAKGMAYTKFDNGKLMLNDKFFELTQSEKTTIAYYYGQALTKLYSERLFKIKWLYHLDNHLDITTLHIKGQAQSKLNISQINKKAEKPDLIGIKDQSSTHIFESKASSWGYKKRIMQHAINQVSQVKKYNNRQPDSLNACYFDLSEKPIQGVIMDPEGEENGMEINIEEIRVVERYYSFFQQNRTLFSQNFQLGEFEFLTVPISEHILFGFDKRILDKTPQNLLETTLYEDSFLNEYTEVEDHKISLGLDGLIIIESQKSTFQKSLMVNLLRDASEEIQYRY